MSAIPKAFKYPIERLNGFSRQKYRLQTQARTSYGPGDQIILDLPVGLLDMSTFTLHGSLSTTGTLDASEGVRAPPIEMCFTDCYVEIGGVAVTNLTYANQLFNVFREFQLFDRKPYREVLQNEPISGADNGQLHQTNVPVAMYNWLGFLGTKVLDTTILPPVRIYLRLAPSTVLAVTGTVPDASYNLANVSFTVDLMDQADGLYQQAIQQRLSTAPLEIPFDNYQVIVGAQGPGGQSTRFSTSTACLTGVMAWFAPSNWLGNGRNVDTRLANYFNRTDGDIDDSQFRINSVPYPSIPARSARGEVFAFTSHALNVAQDTIGASYPTLNTLGNFNDWHFLHMHSFTYDSDGETSRVCGLDARGNQLIGSWDTTATAGASNVTPFVALRMRSILRIGAGKLVETIL
jgi:hypothetical protein